MAKIQRNFRVDKELDLSLKSFADLQGITVSQLIELACYQFLLEKKEEQKYQKNTIKDNKKNRVSLYLPNDTYNYLVDIVNSKNSSLNQEINFRLDASLGINHFSTLELDQLFLINRNISKLGNLFKLSLNNNLNTPELLLDIEKKIMELREELREVRTRSKKRILKI